MFGVLIGFHIVTAFVIIALILLQQGKGAQAGASFGSGASATVFGSQGSGNFLSRTTAILVGMFFIINLSLSALTHKKIAQAERLLAPAQKSQQSEDVPG
jgi:preprotein translocase subunit SecG